MAGPGEQAAAGGYRPMPATLRTRRLFLRLREPPDAAWNLEILAERDGGTTATLADVRAGLGRQVEQARQAGFGFFALRRRSDGEPVGYCGLLVGRCTFDEPEIGYELLRRARGHGYATEAAAAVVDAAFATGRRRLWATVGSDNAASLRVLDKVGFVVDHVDAYDRGELVYLVREAPAG